MAYAIRMIKFLFFNSSHEIYHTHAMLVIRIVYRGVEKRCHVKKQEGSFKFKRRLCFFFFFFFLNFFKKILYFKRKNMKH